MYLSLYIYIYIYICVYLYTLYNYTLLLRNSGNGGVGIVRSINKSQREAARREIISIGWSDKHFNNRYFISSLEINNTLRVSNTQGI